MWTKCASHLPIPSILTCFVKGVFCPALYVHTVVASYTNAACKKITNCFNKKGDSRVFFLVPGYYIYISVVHPQLTQCIIHTFGQNVALILHDVLGAKVPLSGTIENGSNTCHWKFVTSSLPNNEYNITHCIFHCTSAAQSFYMLKKRL